MTQKSENGGLPAALLWVEVLIFDVYPMHLIIDS
jgi:hypothetical protein